MKVYEDGRRKDSSDCMNMLGLDIKKIPFVPNRNRNDSSFTKIEKLKFKNRNGSPLIYKEKETARSHLVRNTTESSDT